MKHWRSIVVSLMFVALILPLPLALQTESGMNWLFQLASRFVPGELRVASLSGTLDSTIIVDRLHYRYSDFSLELQHAELVWQPWKLLTGLLKVNRLIVDGINVHTPSGDADATRQLPQLTLPVRLALDDVAVKNISIQAGDAQTFPITSVQFSARNSHGFILIPWLMADFPDYNLTLNGKVQPQDNYPLEVKGSFTLKQLFDQPFIVEAELKGDLQQLQTTATVNGFVQGEVKGQLLDVVRDMHWDAEAVVRQLGLNSITQNLPANNINGAFHSQGSLQSFSLQGVAETKDKLWGKFNSRFDLILALASEELVIKDLAIEEKNHPTKINTQGSINWSQDEVVYKLAARWRHLAWPWNEPAIFKSATGNLNFSGVIDNYHLNVEGDVDVAGYPATQLSAQTQGTLQQLRFNTLDLQTLQGKIVGSGLLQWQEKLQWQADVSVQQLNPDFFVHDLQAIVSGQVKTSGSWQNNKLTTELAISDISGSVHDNPLSGAAHISILDKDIDIKQLELRIRGSEIQVQGGITNQLALNYQIQSDDLSQVLSDLQGSIKASGALKGSREMPDLSLRLNARNLHYQNYYFATLNSMAEVSLDPEKKLQLTLDATDVSLADTSIAKLQLTGDGTIADHRLSLNLQQQKNAVNFKLAGGLDDFIWRGRLLDSVATIDHLDAWHLEQSSVAVAGKNYLQLEKNCYVQQMSKVCFQADSVDSQIYADFQAENISTDRFAYWMPPQLTLQTLLNGVARLTLKEGELSASAEVHNNAGDLILKLENAEKQFKFQPGKVQLEWTNTRVTSIIKLPLEQDASISAKIELNKSADSQLLDQWPLLGELDMQIPTLVFLSPYIPEVKNLEQANLQARLTLAGTLSQPQLVGEATVRAPLLPVPDLNITLENFVLSLLMNEQQKLTFSASADSGEGTIHVSGESQLDKGKIITAHAAIRGNQFQVIDLPQATVLVSPKLLLQLQQNNLSVEGDIAVPYARLRPTKLPAGTVTETSDVVVVGNEQKGNLPGTRLVIDTKVRLILGDRVSFDGFGLRSKLTGSIQVIDKPDEVSVGRGEIMLQEGYYRSFGQELQISKGRLIYANTPLDDPGLDIRAQRSIGEVVAGVDVSATLRKPEVRLFSIPVMAEADTLSYLLLGRPVRQINEGEGMQLVTAAMAMGLAGGELLARNIGNRLGIEEIMIETNSDTGSSSLVIGRYLSPKLYIRYFTGIFERSNIIQLRYNLTNKVLLQTETGSQMGADVFYTIEH